ncbi:MAG: DotI/IcmL family type IV secretion protein [Deltaproteobacteria bacterium]|nr:DotI/IcmL family type IV secretion protein [Deltaproteobacteria bacterium]
MAAAIVALSVAAFREVKPVYFAVTPDMRITEMVALSEPAMSRQALLNWAGETVMNCLSLDFLHWQAKLRGVEREFAPEAFASLVNSLHDGGHIRKITNQRLNMSAVLDGAPVLTSSGDAGGVGTWKMEIPLKISYQTSDAVLTVQSLKAEATVRRVPFTENPRGVVISQLLMTDAR